VKNKLLILLVIFSCLSLSTHGYSASAAKNPFRTSILLPIGMNQQPIMKIAIAQNVDQINLKFNTIFTLVDIETGKLLANRLTFKDVSLKGSEKGIHINDKIFNARNVRLMSQDKLVQVRERVYRSNLIIIKDEKNKLTLINEIPIEDYLKGVLPMEVSPRWNMEALKAQAVAARTFALFQALNANPESPFFLKRDVSSQVYAGKTVENFRTSEAVNLTRGQILTYRGAVFPAYFHSACGGKTTSADSVWGVWKHPSLGGVQCGFCRGTKHYTWKKEMSFQDMKLKLAKEKIKIGAIQKVQILDRDRSGRVESVNVVHSTGVKKIKGSTFRRIMGYDIFRSTLVELKSASGSLLKIVGNGWGHGVGMCQWGTKVMADKVFRYEQILRFYYPSSQVTQAYSSPKGSRISGTISNWWTSLKGLIS